MPKASTEAAYKEWVKEVESSFPEGKRALWRDLVAGDEGFKLFEGNLRQKEFDRLQNDLHAAEKAVQADRAEIANAMQSFLGDVERVKAWYDEEAPKNKKIAEEYRKLYAEHEANVQKLRELGLEDDFGTTSRKEIPIQMPQNDELVKEVELLKRRIALQDQAFPKVLADFGAVLTEAQKEGLSFDSQALIKHASENGVDLKQAFKALTGSQREEREKKLHEEALEKAKEEGRREAMSKFHSPERIGPVSASPVDAVLSGKVPSREDRIGNAAKAWMEGGGNLTGM